LSYDQKHPLLLPKDHPFSEVIARYYHQTHLYAEPKLLQALIRDRFWIIRGLELSGNALFVIDKTSQQQIN